MIDGDTSYMNAKTPEEILRDKVGRFFDNYQLLLQEGHKQYEEEQTKLNSSLHKLSIKLIP